MGNGEGEAREEDGRFPAVELWEETHAALQDSVGKRVSDETAALLVLADVLLGVREQLEQLEVVRQAGQGMRKGA